MLKMSLVSVLGVLAFNTTSGPRSANASGLGEPCSNGSSCATPFSECSLPSRICVCQAGFNQSGPFCTPSGFRISGYNCPVGAPYILNGEIVPCVRRTTTRPPIGRIRTGGFIPTQSLVSLQDGPPGGNPTNQETTSFTRNDTCPENYACFTYGPELANTTVQSGHCCMVPRAVCPVGDVLKNAICPGSPILVPGQVLCPLETHYCAQPFVAQGQNNNGLLCCRTPCTTPGSIYRNRRCYRRVGIGETCEFDDQCTVEGSTCADSGNSKQCVCETPQIFVRLLNVCAIPQCGFLRGSLPQRNRNGEFIRCRSLTIAPVGNRGMVPQNTNYTVCPPQWLCDPIFEVCCARFPAL